MFKGKNFSAWKARSTAAALMLVIAAGAAEAGTSRGFGVAEFTRIGQLIVKVLDGLAKNGEDGNAAVEAEVAAEVKQLTARFPIYA